MKEERVLEYLIKEKGIDKEKLKKILENKPKSEDIVSFLIGVGLISYEDLNALAEFTFSRQPINKNILEKQGITFEDAYFHYIRCDGVLFTVPYYHIRAIEKCKNNINIYTGGIEKISIELEDEDSAEAFLDIVLLYIDKIFLQRLSI